LVDTAYNRDYAVHSLHSASLIHPCFAVAALSRYYTTAKHRISLGR